jgi:hypothetical protein
LVKAKIALVFLCLTLLQGCSSVTRIAYDHADTYLRWQANGYFDFEGEQALELDRRLEALLAWHRTAALPQYARLAEDASSRVLRGITREDLEWAYDAVKKQVGETLGAAAADSAGLLDRLNPGQIAHFEMRLAEENRKFAKEQMQGTVEQRRKRRVKLNVERLEQWFGTLNEAQVERVRRYSARAPLSADLRDRDRKRRQSELLALLRAREARQHLVQWAQAWDRGREPAYASAAHATEAEYFDLLLDLDRLLTPAQRAACAKRLLKYAALFDTLARQ